MDNNLIKTSIHFKPIGPFFIQKHETQNLYLFSSNTLKVLIDLPPVDQFMLFEEQISTYCEISEITHLIIQLPSLSLVNTMRRLNVDGFKGQIITTQPIKEQLLKNDISKDIETIESLEYNLFLEDFKFSFLPMQFLPFPLMFMSYEANLNALCSSTLFSSYYQPDSKDTDLKNLVFAYHKANMPSSEYIKDPLKRIRQHQIKTILPAFGTIILKDIDQMIDYEYHLDFYNTYQVFKYNDEFAKEFNYIEIINHMISHLKKHIDRDEIYDTFSKSEFILSKKPLELKTTSLAGYKLWNAFFEFIYAKKGLVWLTILEPLVKRYNNSFGLELPTVYMSKMVEITKSNEQLQKVNKELEESVEKLSNQVEETKDAILRCPITKLYNEQFFRELLKKDLTTPMPEHKTTGYILIQLDQINELNKRYGKETGDEAIRNLAYQTTQVIPEEATLFKQSGPGIILYIQMVSPKTINEVALKVRNAIRDSILFIEKVTASLSIVTLDEVSPVLTTNEKIKQIFTLLDKRIHFARQIGNGEIVDQKSILPVASEGIILLVDEDDINRNMLYRIFNRIHFEVKMAASVEEAITIVDSYPVDLIISEINLSKMDGFGLKRHLNESKEHANIPFIMVSHNKTLENIKRGNVLDVDLIIEKPIIPEELIGHVKRMREKRNNL